jgi:hypothetical protein
MVGQILIFVVFAFEFTLVPVSTVSLLTSISKCKTKRKIITCLDGSVQTFPSFCWPSCVDQFEFLSMIAMKPIIQ